MSGQRSFMKPFATLLTAVVFFANLFVPFLTVKAYADKSPEKLAASSNLDLQGRSGELLVKFKPGFLPDKVLKEFEVMESLELKKLGVIKIKVDQAQYERIARVLKSHSAVKFVEPNNVYRASLVEPVDAMYSQQWGLKSIETAQGWEKSHGEGVRVAVLDSGVDLNHQDLAPNLDRKADGSINGYNVFNNESLYSKNGSSYESNPLPKDLSGHGTHVAGIIAAAQNNTGIVGVAPKAKIMPVKVLDETGYGDDVGISYGVRWAVENGARVINLSLGSANISQVLKEAIDYATSKGVVVVAAAGNEGKGTVAYPAALPNVISVAATDRTNQRLGFSNYGQGLDVSAPGAGILSTLPTYNVKLNQEGAPNNYGLMNGTSMAAPFVSGLAALIISENNTLNPAQVEEKIKTSATDLGSIGNDIYYGMGLINVNKALNQGVQVPTDTTPTPTPTPNPAPALLPESNFEQKATVTVNQVNVRSGPGTWNSIISVVKQGEVFVVYGSEGRWSKVRLGYGTTGYIATSLIKFLEETGTITVSAVNVRSGPGVSYSKIGLVVREELFKMLGAVNNWYKVRLGSGTVGFVAGWLVKVVDQPQQQTGQNAVITVSWANIRTGPGTNYSVLATLPKGTTVSINGMEGNWYKISLSDGRTGYIYKTLVTPQ